jgi:hydroxypyruvate reductase
MNDDTKDELRAVFDEVIEACDPQRLVADHVRLDDSALCVGERRYDLDAYDKIYVVGAGKAAAPMAVGLEDILGNRIDEGLVVVREGYAQPTRVVEVVEASHPTPDARSIEAGQRIARLCRSATADDLVLVLISGGGSALLIQPAAELTLDDVQTTVDALVTSGADIQSVNTVRKHISAVKGGHLAAAIAPATSASLILSDVIGNDISSVASGPTAPDTTTFADALAVFERHDLFERVPGAITDHLRRGRDGEFEETIKPGADAFERAQHLIVGDARTAADAAQQAFERRGCDAATLATELVGEAGEVGRVIAALGKQAARSGHARPRVWVLAGETTVTVRGEGLGGRNQELALAAAIDIDSFSDLYIASFATDGTDGPTDAAGAIVDGRTITAIRDAGLDPRARLDDNDAYPALDAADALVRTGPTRTNLNDLVVILGR